MIIGINTSYEYENKPYHIQIEDLGEAKQSLEIRVYLQGSLIWQKRLPYAAGATDLSNQDRTAAIRDQMGKLLATVKAGINQGKIK